MDIGWGSTVKVSYSPIQYTVNGKSGVTLYFNAVQILDLVEYEGATGFGEEEGFVAEEPTDNPFVTNEETTESDNEEDF